jgi:hypothetical protein
MTAKLDGTNGLIQQYVYSAPATGFSYTFPAGINVLVLNPAGTLATGTIIMPASPADGMTITFSSTQTITALTVNANAGQSIVSAPTKLPAGQSATFVYRLTGTSWYPISYVPQLIGSSGLATAVQPIGVDQTWQDLTASRAFGTTYTNTTGRPIQILISNNNSSAAVNTLTINGVAVSVGNETASTGRVHRPGAVIPAGGTYVWTASAGTPSNLIWAELR